MRRRRARRVETSCQGRPPSAHGFPQMLTAQPSGTIAAMSEHHHPLPPTQLLSYNFARFPDGPTRQTWPGLVYWRVRPTWIRYSNFNVNPPIIQEWDATAIAGWL